MPHQVFGELADPEIIRSPRQVCDLPENCHLASLNRELAGQQPDVLPIELHEINRRQRGPDHEPSQRFAPRIGVAHPERFPSRGRPAQPHGRHAERARGRGGYLPARNLEYG